jgi:hypothetical protein
MPNRIALRRPMVAKVSMVLGTRGDLALNAEGSRDILPAA